MSAPAASAVGPSNDPVAAALAALRSGLPALVVDGDRPAGSGGVVLAGALADPRSTAWMVRHSAGILYVPLAAELADALELPPMVPGTTRGRSAFTVSVDAARGVSTGISAKDRSQTARVLADPATRPADLTRPGHVLPRRVEAGTTGPAQDAVHLCRLAGLPAVAMTAELVDAHGAQATRSDVRELSRAAGLSVLEAAALQRHRLHHGDGTRPRVTRGTTVGLRTEHGLMRATGYRDELSGVEHLALTGGHAAGIPLVCIHVECLLGEVFGSLACDCARRLDASLDRVDAEGGVVVYLRRSRGSHATGGAATTGGHAIDPVDAAAAAGVLADLGHTEVRLMRGAVTADDLAPSGIAVASMTTSDAGAFAPAAGY